MHVNMTSCVDVRPSRLIYIVHIYFIYMYTSMPTETLEVESAGSSDLLLFYQTTRRDISEDRITKSYPVESTAA